MLTKDMGHVDNVLSLGQALGQQLAEHLPVHLVVRVVISQSLGQLLRLGRRRGMIRVFPALSHCSAREIIGLRASPHPRLLLALAHQDACWAS